MPEWMPVFECRVVPDRDAAHVKPVGELDIATIGVVDERLRELRSAGFSTLVLDVGSITFIDSTGIHLLVRWSQEASQDGFAFSLAGRSEPVERVLSLTGLRDRLAFLD
jgi:anti-sigma B factor antagonist